MKILIMSDCHANVDALNAVWEKENDCDYIIFAGDMVDWGFFPKETVRWFLDKKDKLFAVLGNHDEHVIKIYNEFCDSKDDPKLFEHYTCQLLDKEEFDFLNSIPHENTFTIGDIGFYMCHYPDEINNTDEFFVENQFAKSMLRPLFNERFNTKFADCNCKKKIMIFGHTHLSWAAQIQKDCHYINPGSLSYRFIGHEEVRCAEYAVYEDGNIALKHVDFDTTHLRKLVEDSTLEDWVKNTARHFYREV